MSLHELAMRRASEILFWVAVLLFLGGFATPLLLGMSEINTYSPAPGVTPGTLVTAIFQGLNAAVWPFTGAGLIWVLKARQPGTFE